MAPRLLFSRQDISGDDGRDRSDDRGDWWYSDEAEIIKWVILAAIVLLFFTYLLGGYLHARRRMRKGLPPLGYHRVCSSAFYILQTLTLVSGLCPVLNVVNLRRNLISLSSNNPVTNTA